MKLVVVVALLATAACTRALAPVDVSDVLVACAPDGGGAGVTQVSCNEDLIAASADAPFFGDERAFLDTVVDAVKQAPDGGDVESTDGAVLVAGEEMPAKLLTVHGDDVDYTGSAVVHGAKVSLCVAAVDMKDGAAACTRVHEALLRDGRALLEQRVDAARALPRVVRPRVPEGCDLDDGGRGTFRIECDDAVVDVAWPGDDVRQALDDARDDAMDDAWDDGDPSVDVVDGTCALLGTKVPCVSVVGSWTVRMAAVQTVQGRRLVECGVAGAREPVGDLCPRLVEAKAHKLTPRPDSPEDSY